MRGRLPCRTARDTLGQSLQIRATVPPVWFQVVALGPFVPRLDEYDASPHWVLCDDVGDRPGHLRFEEEGVRTLQDDSASATPGRVVEAGNHRREARAVGDPERHLLRESAIRAHWRDPELSCKPSRPVGRGDEPRWHSFRGERVEICRAGATCGLRPTDEEDSGQPFLCGPGAPEVEEALRLGKIGWFVDEEHRPPIDAKVPLIHECGKNCLKVGPVVLFTIRVGIGLLNEGPAGGSMPYSRPRLVRPSQANWEV